MYDGQCLYFEKENDGSYKGTGTALEILFELSLIHIFLFLHFFAAGNHFSKITPYNLM